MTRRRDYRDLIGGLFLVVIGLSAALYASDQYEIGQLNEMGPGMFPTAIGYILAGLGVLLAAPAFFRAGELPKPEYRELFTIVGGVLLFALTISRLGVIAALFLLTAAAVAALKKVNLIESLVLYAAITIGAVLLFRTGLGIPLPLFKWEF